MPEPKRNPAGAGGVPESSAVAGRPPQDTPPLFDLDRPRTDPDPAARRRNLEQGRRPAAAPREVADAGAQAVIANTPLGPRDIAEQCLNDLIAVGEPFDAETLRRCMGGHILGAHPNAIAAVFRMASNDGRIRQVGWREASRPEARGRVLRVWVGTEVQG